MDVVGAQLLTGGVHNRVVSEHGDLCHHCGYIDGEVRRCATCGVRAHPECVTIHGGQCDACVHGLADANVCVVCERPESEAATDTGRLIRTVVYHGRTWRREEDDEEDATLSLVPSTHPVAHALDGAKDVFEPFDLPDGGTRAMRVVTPDGTAYRSVPLVAHTWCIECAFQQVMPRERPMDAQRVEECWRLLLDNLRSPVARDHAQTGQRDKVAVVTPHNACVFCGSAHGYRTFCYDHMDCRTSRGCKTCHWAQRTHLTYRCFHPSCAVRYGMRRYVAPTEGGSGMLCDTSATARFKTLVKTPRHSRAAYLTLQMLEASSGVNRNLPLVTVDRLRVDHQTLRLGARHLALPTVAAPPRQKRARGRAEANASQHLADVYSRMVIVSGEDGEQRGGDEDHEGHCHDCDECAGEQEGSGEAVRDAAHRYMTTEEGEQLRRDLMRHVGNSQDALLRRAIERVELLHARLDALVGPLSPETEAEWVRRNEERITRHTDNEMVVMQHFMDALLL